MGIKHKRPRIGLRTIKTAAAVMIAMVIVHFYGTSDAKLIFAMLGAMDAVQPTVKDSLRACLTQIVGVLLGALMGIAMLALKLNPLVSIGIGIVAVITLYNYLGIRFSPSLPCLILVTLCTTPEIQPMSYALGRIWDSAIGLSVGTAINALVFPYDNSRRIRSTIESLDKELILFLEEMFDGDDTMPDAARMEQKVADMARELTIFTNQRLVTHRNRQRKQIASFQLCQSKARELLARMEVLSLMEKPGRLNKENIHRLRSCGANITAPRSSGAMKERDVVANYHVNQILKLRRELLDALE